MSVGDSQERPSAARVAQTAPFESSHTTIAVPLPSTARSAAYSEPCPTDQVAIVVGRPQPVLGSKRMACMLVQGQKSGGGQWSQTTIACPWASMATIGEMSKASSPVSIAVGEPHPGPFTTDPARVLNALAKRLGGGLLPLGGEGEDLGGHKGYGLALMVDVLCGVLSGAATGLQVYADEKKPDVGHFFMALDPTAFRPLDEFRRDMDRLARELKESPKAHGQDRIYVHGEKSFARMEKFRTEGIPLDPKVVEGLKKIGADLGISWSA